MKPSAYHHGDLKRQLLATGTSLLRTGGPSALSAREATRELHVSVTALYRHFDSVEQWRADVSRCAREELARSMLAAISACPATRSRSLAARRKFRAVGSGYIAFAIEEPLLFMGAFMPYAAAPSEPDDPSAWSVLQVSLDELVAAGALDPGMRADAPVIAWTAVHGLSALVVQGALDVTSAQDPRVRAVLDGVARALGISLRGLHDA